MFDVCQRPFLRDVISQHKIWHTCKKKYCDINVCCAEPRKTAPLKVPIFEHRLGKIQLTLVKLNPEKLELHLEQCKNHSRLFVQYQSDHGQKRLADWQPFQTFIRLFKDPFYNEQCYKKENGYQHENQIIIWFRIQLFICI